MHRYVPPQRSIAACEGYAKLTCYLSITSIQPLFQKLADEAIVREAIDNDSFRMSPTIHPLPRTITETQFTKETDVFNLWFMVVL